MDVIENKRLYFCNPSEFNDPFDCKPLISIRYNKTDEDRVWYRFLSHLTKYQYPKLSESEIKKHTNVAFTNGLYKNRPWLSGVNKSLRNIDPSVRVCCFGKSPRNSMMWAHYAQNYAGIMLQFRTSGLYCKNSGEFRGKQVDYLDNPLDIKKYIEALEAYENGDLLAMDRLFYTTKTKHWETEDEVRFFSNSDQKYVSFDESTLSGIIFGDKCSQTLVRQVLDNLATWHQRPRLFQVSIKKSTHKLWVEKYAGPQ